MKPVKAIVVKTNRLGTTLRVHALILEMAEAVENKPALYAVAWQVEAHLPSGDMELMREVFDQDPVTKRAPVFVRADAERWALEGLTEATQQVEDQKLQYHMLIFRKLKSMA